MGSTPNFLIGCVKKQEVVKKKNPAVLWTTHWRRKRLKRKHEKSTARLLEGWQWRQKERVSRESVREG